MERMKTLPSLKFTRTGLRTLQFLPKSRLLWRINDKNFFRERVFQTSSLATSSSPETRTPQPFDYSAMRACVWDLKQRWVPSRVENVIQHETKSLSLQLRTVIGTGWLILSWDPTFAHVGLSESGPRRGSISEAFVEGDQVKSALKGLIMVKAEMLVDWERVARLTFAERPQEEAKLSLYVEMMGKYSNIVLCDSKDQIVLAGNQIGNKKSSQRQIRVKSMYNVPPRQIGISPTEIANVTEFKKHLSMVSSDTANALTFDKALTRTFCGIGPGNAKEIRFRAGLSDDPVVTGIDDKIWLRLFEEWTDWLLNLSTNDYSCGVIDQLGIYSLKECSGDDNVMPPLEFFEYYYGSFEHGGEFQKVCFFQTSGMKLCFIIYKLKIIAAA